ncbi:MAG: flagellar filament capping protein FliD [Peptococcaceae bacterium]|nr:flagellar filament capping protein FliD [Peptococcaceae bacterium]
MSISTSGVGGVYGLSGSGIDVDEIVKSLMKAQQTRLDSLTQKKTLVEWQKTAYNEIYDLVNNFSKTVFNYRLESTISPMTVASSNSSVVTATASGDALAASHALIVAQLASGVNLTSSAAITPAGASKANLGAQFGVENDFSLILFNGHSETTIDISVSDSINDVVSKINKAGIGVSAGYDSGMDRFFITTTNTGTAAGIGMKTVSANVDGTNDGKIFIDALNIFGNPPVTSDVTDGVSMVTTTTTEYAAVYGKDAVFQLDGASFTQSTNSFSIFGVNYTLTGTSAGTLATDVANGVFSGQATAVTITKDTSKAVESIQALVDSYNKVLESINSKIAETRYKDYLPLTDTQKAGMKDTEILLWTAKAQSGLLRNNSTLTALVSSMRNALSNSVSGISGIYTSASTIGITTGSYSEGGKLYLDTAKLTAALEADPDALMNLFAGANGIATRLYDGIDSSLKKLSTLAGTTANESYDTESSLAKTISRYNLQISNETLRFDSLQSMYYTRFNAMEVAIQSLSQQSNWLSSLYTTTSS